MRRFVFLFDSRLKPFLGNPPISPVRQLSVVIVTDVIPKMSGFCLIFARLSLAV